MPTGGAVPRASKAARNLRCIRRAIGAFHDRLRDAIFHNPTFILGFSSRSFKNDSQFLIMRFQNEKRRAIAPGTFSDVKCPFRSWMRFPPGRTRRRDVPGPRFHASRQLRWGPMKNENFGVELLSTDVAFDGIARSWSLPFVCIVVYTREIDPHAVPVGSECGLAGLPLPSSEG